MIGKHSAQKSNCFNQFKFGLNRKIGLFALMCGLPLFTTNVSYASSKTADTPAIHQTSDVKDNAIKGVVKDKNGDPLIGVSISVGKSGVGTITDFNGEFSLKASSNDVLSISYIGYKTQEVKVGTKTNLDIVLVEDDLLLDEVVVTALGIKKEAKALTYNVQEVKSDELIRVKSANFMNSLNGKIAGVNINTSSSGVGGAVRVVMRGVKSIAGNNNAMYVVDGVPMPSSAGIQPTDMFTGMGQTGDGASMINPNDIESISVLSGAAASALYGSNAANGVIMITTKKGEEQKLSVNVSNSTTFSNPFVMPEFQDTYGSDLGSFDSWGEKLATPSGYRPKDFFQTGYDVSNTVSISTGTKTNQSYISVGSTNARGIIHNNDLDKYNFSFKNTSQLLNDKLHLDVSFMYIKTKEQNMLAQGQYFNPLIPVYLFPRGDDMSKYKTYERFDPSRNLKTQYWPYGDMGLQMQNPYWITNRDMFDNDKDRMLLSGGAKYDILDWLSVAGRVKYDTDKYVSEKKYYASTSGLFAGPAGAYHVGDTKNSQLYADFMVNINKYFGDFSLTAVLGASITDTKYDYRLLGGNLQSVPNLFSIRNLNLSTARIDHQGFRQQEQAVFGTAQLGYKSMVYLDVTARNDWNSALAGTKSDSFFYPSVGLSLILTEMLPIKSSFLSFLKTRFSYSEVGNAPMRHMGIPTYPVINGYPQTTTTLPNPDLKPERTQAYEFGINSMFWNDKIKFDLTLYHSSTKDQLFYSSLPSSTGYTSFYANGGRVDNKGIELSLGLNQKLGPVDWETNFVYTINKNTIKELSYVNPLTNEREYPEEIDMGGAENYKMKLRKGGSMGDVYVNTLKTDEHGYIYVDIISQTVTPDEKKFVKAGNANPKYTLGWRNNFHWKGINLGFLINARIGGVIVSSTQALMDAYGVSKESAMARDNGGVLVNGEKIPAKSYYQTVGGGVSGIGSVYTYSATNVRLAELSLGYNIPINKYCKWIKDLNVSVIGRNLLMFYKKAPVDPELTASTGTYFQGLDYFMQPSLRNIGFSVNVKF